MTKRKYDAELEPLLAALPTVQDFSTVEKVRAVRDLRAMMLPPPPDRADVTKADRLVPAAAQFPQVPVRIYTPTGEATAPRGCVLEIHGGGFMLGNIAMMDPWCQKVAAEIDAVVISVEYRLAPEDPFPASVDDCYAALCWAADHASELGIDAARIAIAGQSAGGGIAAGTALMARDKGGPALCFQLLEIPELDDRLDTPSMLAFQDTPLWNRPNAVWSWKHYLGASASRDVSPYAAPSRAKDVAGLPPAYVSTMEFDPLRDEGILYALRMLQAGVSVELHSVPGTFHGSGMMPTADVSRRNAQEVIDVLRRALVERA